MSEFLMKTAEVEKVRSDESVKLERARMRHAIVVPQKMTNAELMILSSYMAPNRVKSEHKLDSAHPVASALLSYASSLAYAGDQPVLDIGSNLRDFVVRAPEGSHTCVLIDPEKGARDEARYKTQMRGRQVAGLLRAQNFRGVYARDCLHSISNMATTASMCVDGAQHCHKSYQRAISVHSAYDITPEMWMMIFQNHDLESADLFMHLPVEMLTMEASCEDGVYMFETVRSLKGTRVRFSFPGDSSFVYEHNRENWVWYLKNCGINGLARGYGFNLVFEIANRWGPMVWIKVTKVYSGGELRRNVSMMGKQMVLIPRLQEMLCCGMTRKYDIAAPAEKISKIRDYMQNSADSDIAYPKMFSFMRSLRSNVVLGAKVVSQEWHILDDDFHDVSMTLWIMGMIDRYRRTQETARGMKRLKLEQKAEKSFTSRFKLWLKDRGHDLYHYLWMQDSKVAHFGRHHDPRRREQLFRKDWLLDLSYECLFNVSYATELDWNANGGFWLHMVEGHPDEEEEDDNSEKRGCYGCGFEPKFNYELCFKEYREHLRTQVERIGDNDKNALTETIRQAYGAIANVDNYTRTMLWTVVDGGPGTGKSRAMLEKANAEDVIITPVNDLKDELCSKAEKKGLDGLKILTPHVALFRLKNHKIRRLFVDEGFMFTPGWFVAMNAVAEIDEFVICGDENQINFIDFEQDFSSSETLKTVVAGYKRHRLPQTYRCPQDITWLLNKRFGYEKKSALGVEPLYCASNVIRSIRVITGEVFTTNGPGVLNLCFTQKAKSGLAAMGIVARTVHESQGTDRQYVNLYLTNDAKSLISSSKAHVVVALTRHTDELRIINNGEDCLLTYLMGGALPTENFDRYIMPLPKETHIHHVDTSTVAVEVEEHNACPPDAYDPVRLEQILSKVTTLDNTNLLLVQPNEMADAGEYMRLNPDSLFEKNLSGVKVKRMGHKTAGKTYESRDMFQTVATAVSRYAKKTKNPPNPEVLGKNMADAFFDKLCDKVATVTEEMVVKCLDDAWECMQKKGSWKAVLEYDESDKNCWTVDFFLKKIVKCKVVDSNPQMLDKAGQGVAAHSKTIVALTGAVFRAVELALKASLKDNVCFANGEDDEKYAQLAQSYLQDDSIIYEADATEYDSSQNEVTRYCEKQICKRLGIRSWFLQWYYDMLRTDRTFRKLGLFKLKVRDKKDSGASDTLIGNIMVTACNVAYFMKWVVLHLMFIKGDDNSTAGFGLEVDQAKLNEVAKMGMKWKLFKADIMQFCNKLYTRKGQHPDLVNRCMKLYSRQYLNVEDVIKYQDAVRDQMKMVKTPSDVNWTIEANHVYYPMLPTCELKFIYEMMMTYIKMDPEELYNRKFITQRLEVMKPGYEGKSKY